MNKKLLEKAKSLASRNYETHIRFDQMPDGKTIFMASNPELDGCMAQGASEAEALENLRDARVDYIYDSLVNSNPVPDPSGNAPADALNFYVVLNSSSRVNENNAPAPQPTTISRKKKIRYSNRNSN